MKQEKKSGAEGGGTRQSALEVTAVSPKDVKRNTVSEQIILLLVEYALRLEKNLRQGMGGINTTTNIVARKDVLNEVLTRLPAEVVTALKKKLDQN